MAGDTGILGKEAGLSDFSCDAAESFNDLGGCRDTALIGSGVDGCNGSGDNWVISSKLLHSNKFANERFGNGRAFQY